MKKDNNQVDLEKLDERIERFLRDEMNEQEAKEFRAELKTNPLLAERAEALAVLIKSIRQVGQKHDERIKQSVLNSSVQKERIPERRTYKLYMNVVALAASVLLLVGIADFFMARQRTQELALSSMQYAPQFEATDGAFKGGEEDSVLVADLQQTFEDIRNDVQLDRSIEHLSELFSLACSEKVNPYTDYADYIGYNLAIAYLKDNDRREARKVLVRLVELYLNYQDAKNLLIEINQLKGLW